MTSRGSKASVFRNIFVVPNKEAYRELPIAKDLDMGRAISVSTDHLAFGTAPRGMVAVVGLEQLGLKSAAFARSLLHSGGLVDMEHSPFCPRVLASGGEDGTVKISCIREGGADIKFDCIAQVQEKKDRKIMSLNWNPVAEHVLASTTIDGHLNVWDLENGESTISGSVHKPWMLQWNQNGQQIALVDTERVISLVDPRTSIKPILTSEPFVKSNKICRINWLQPYDGSEHGLAALGFEGMGDRFLKTFDTRNFSKPMQSLKLPGKSSGLPFLHFDPTSSILFITARGESSCNVLEWADKTLTLMPDQKFPKQASNCGFLPKRAVSVVRNEIARTFRTEYESKSISVASFVINRKSEEFAEDLHTVCPTGEPALAAPDWFAGENEQLVTGQMHAAEEGELQFPDREPENTAVLNFDTVEQ